MASKYGNVATIIDGIRFDSKKEAQRWVVLEFALASGEIQNLGRQVRYALHGIGGVKIATYIADFVYVQDGVRVVEDVKSPITRKNAMYRLKKRWMKAEYGIDIREC